MRHRKVSILKKILLPLLILLILQSTIFYAVIAASGIFTDLRNNAKQVTKDLVDNRAAQLETEFLYRTDLSATLTRVQSIIRDFSENTGRSPKNLALGDSNDDVMLQKLTTPLVQMIRKNRVTGGFIFLETPDKNHKSGLYLRDPDLSFSSADFSDLTTLRGPLAVSKSAGISLDPFWLPDTMLIQGEENSSFYYSPFSAAENLSGLSSLDLGYWSKPFSFVSGNEAQPCITYSVPLLDEMGQPYGVIGVEVSLSYLSTYLPAEELGPAKQSGYVLGMNHNLYPTSKTPQYRYLMGSNSFVNQLDQLPGNEIGLEVSGDTNDSFLTANLLNEHFYVSTAPLHLYNTNSPFSNEHWTVLGLISENVLFGFSHRFEHIMYLCLALSSLIGLSMIFFFARLISKPINILSEQLRKADPNKPLFLQSVGITELDNLSELIGQLSTDVSGSARRLSRILKMAGISIGAFEYKYDSPDMVFCTDQFFSVFGKDDLSNKSRYIQANLFHSFMKNLLKDAEKQGEGVYLLSLNRNNSPFWVRCNLIEDEGGMLGVAIDITEEIMEKRRLEYERDFDLLTSLYNRRAFHRKVSEILSSRESDTLGAIMILDLDNLKFINNTYGHDYGDEYLHRTAMTLLRNSGTNAVCARLSGDEFALFFYDFTEQSTVRNIISNLEESLKKTFIYLPDDAKVPLRASAGIAWYPQDATTLKDLMRYADFAMYLVKRTHRGHIEDFDLDRYHSSAYLVQNHEELNSIIERKLIDYAFQPIFNAVTGEIFAFEALMRPRSENIKDPSSFLSLAKTQGRLGEIEILSLFEALKRFSELEIAKGNCRLFINSIANQFMSEPHVEQFAKIYAPYLSRLVIEITEGEESTLDYTLQKKKIAENWGAAIAVDDFGVGYSGERVLLEVSPGFIKIDMSIIQDIHTDNNRRELVENLLSYAKSRGICTIAEGVESREDLEVLLDLGIDYVQGFFLAKSSFLPTEHAPAAKEEILYAQKKLLQKKEADLLSI